MAEKLKGFSIDCLTATTKELPVTHCTSYSRRMCWFLSASMESGQRPSGMGFRSSINSLIDASDSRMTIEVRGLTFRHHYATLRSGSVAFTDRVANRPKPSSKNEQGEKPFTGLVSFTTGRESSNNSGCEALSTSSRKITFPQSR